MSALTTRQRDLLIELLHSEAPIGAEALAETIGLTSRQVKYDLKGVKQWLSIRGVDLKIKPGIGIQLNCTEELYEKVKKDLRTLSELQLILLSSERQQLLALFLLISESSKNLSELVELTQVSRTTVIKDLDQIESFFNKSGGYVIRRPNYGIEIEDDENVRQTIITMILWGETPFGKSLFHIDHQRGLVFSLHNDSHLNPLVNYCDQVIQTWDLNRVFPKISYIENELGGHFPDDAVLHLALVIALQTQRISSDHHLDIPRKEIEMLQRVPVWEVAKMVSKQLGWKLTPEWKETDIAGIAMWILASPRDRRFEWDLSIDPSFSSLISELMETIAKLYDAPQMKNDQILRDGLSNHIIPACFRKKYKLWQPLPYPDFVISEKYSSENQVALQLSLLIEKKTSYSIPITEINNIAALLRAARIRIRPFRYNKVLVVCPGGMASAQLLMSRLEARFPRLGPLQVISVRELSDSEIESADLIISTVPLGAEIKHQIEIIQVHPLLKPSDIEKINTLIS